MPLYLLKQHPPQDPLISLLGIYSGELSAMCLQNTYNVNVYSSFLHNCPKLETNSNGHQGEQTHKLYTPTVEYHSARKRSKPLVHATTRMKLRDIMLSKTRQVLERTYSMVLCTIRSPKTGETHLWC